MVTAADGAEEFYSTLKNNDETAEQAIELDKKLINAWVGHPHLTIIDNKKTNFMKKVDKCVETVCKYIGLPTNRSFYKKFLLGVTGHFEVNMPKNIKMEYFQQEISFLVPKGE